MYINDYTYRLGFLKNVMNKGEVGNEDLSNPGIWLLPNNNTLRVQVGLEMYLLFWAIWQKVLF